MSKDNEKDLYQSEEIEDQDYQTEESNKQPWNRNYSQDENLKKRQFSRAARNQPAKEATTLSKVLLGVMILTVIAPFLLFFVVNSMRDNDDISNRTTQNITYQRNDNETTHSSTTSTTTSRESSESVTSRESVESIETTQAPQTTIQETVPPEPEPQPATQYYTVQGGDSWFAIARNYGIDVYELAAFNGMSIDTPLFPGDTVAIP